MSDDEWRRWRTETVIRVAVPEISSDKNKQIGSRVGNYILWSMCASFDSSSAVRRRLPMKLYQSNAFDHYCLWRSSDICWPGMKSPEWRAVRKPLSSRATDGLPTNRHRADDRVEATIGRTRSPPKRRSRRPFTSLITSRIWTYRRARIGACAASVPNETCEKPKSGRHLCEVERAAARHITTNWRSDPHIFGRSCTHSVESIWRWHVKLSDQSNNAPHDVDRNVNDEDRHTHRFLALLQLVNDVRKSTVSHWTAWTRRNKSMSCDSFIFTLTSRITIIFEISPQDCY